MDLYMLTVIDDGQMRKHEPFTSEVARSTALRVVADAHARQYGLPDDFDSVASMSLDDIGEWMAEDGVDVYLDTVTVADPEPALVEHITDPLYVAEEERFVVSLIASYGNPDGHDDGVTCPEQAVAALMQLVSDGGSGDTQFRVTDRRTGQSTMIELSEAIPPGEMVCDECDDTLVVNADGAGWGHEDTTADCPAGAPRRFSIWD